jgi:hypothetical protein
VDVLVGTILLNVISDAGGLFGRGHPVPPGPVEVVLSALPTLLAERLAPIVEEARPEFAEAMEPLRRQLHRRLSHAIAEYRRSLAAE